MELAEEVKRFKEAMDDRMRLLLGDGVSISNAFHLSLQIFCVGELEN